MCAPLCSCFLSQILAEHYPAMRVLNATQLLAAEDVHAHPALQLANRSAGTQAVFQLAGFLVTLGPSPSP